MIQVFEHPSAIFLMKAATELPLAVILEKTNAKPISSYRQLLIWFLWYEGVPLDGIVETTGRDRTTILYAVKRIDELVSVTDRETITLIDKINALKQKYAR